MKVKTIRPFWQAIALGVLAGMRIMSAPLIANKILSRTKRKYLLKSPLNFMQSKKPGIAFKLIAAGEMIGDKLPKAPNRIEPAGLIGRCLSGSLAGASIFKASGNNAFQGAVIGLIAAGGSAFASYYLRKSVVRKTEIPDMWIGAAEDMLVIGAGVVLIRNEINT